MKKFLITGATGEIGDFLCHYIGKTFDNNTNLIITARNEEKLINLKNQLNQKYQLNVHVIPSDFSNIDTFGNFDNLIEDGIDGIVIMPPRPIEPKSGLPDYNTWQTSFHSSFMGPADLVRYFIPALEKKAGSVIFVSGISSCQPLSQYVTNNVLRTAMLGFNKTCADLYGPKNIRFNMVSFGGIMTDTFIKRVENEAMQENIPYEDALSRRFTNVPLRKYADLEEVSGMICFLLDSTPSKHITGQNMLLDGGFTRKY